MSLLLEERDQDLSSEARCPLDVDADHINERASVSAELNAPLNIWQPMLAPVVKMNVRKALDRGLAEDKLDLESGSYPG